MDSSSFDVYAILDIFLLLLIGVGPKIALVPFVELTAGMEPATKARVLRKMLVTAAVVSVALLLLGGVLSRLLHFSTGALSVASGLILVIIAIGMVRGPSEKSPSSGGPTTEIRWRRRSIRSRSRICSTRPGSSCS